METVVHESTKMYALVDRIALKSTSGHLKIGQSYRWAVAAASRKPTEEKHNVVSPKAANRNMWS